MDELQGLDSVASSVDMVYWTPTGIRYRKKRKHAGPVGPGGRWEIPARTRQDKKPLNQRQWLAAIRWVSATFGTVTEVMDAIYAITRNIKVRYGGQWMSLEQFKAMASAEGRWAQSQVPIQVDYQQIMLDMLANSAIDHYVSTQMKMQLETLKNTPMYNTPYGTPLVWANRIGN